MSVSEAFASQRRSRPVSTDQVRLVARVARMYHDQGLRQTEIAARLHISQTKVSRLLQTAVDLGIVRTVVSLPSGVHTDLEEAIEERYGLEEVVVADVQGVEETSLNAVGAAAARHLESTLGSGDRVGISSWSETLLFAINSMHTVRGMSADVVVQLVGGLGDPRVQLLATSMLGRFAGLLSAEQVFMPTPAVLGSVRARDELFEDRSIDAVVRQWETLTVALVGIGSLDPSPMLRQSGNISHVEERTQLAELGAVGDVCLRYFDADGRAVHSDFDERVMGISATCYLKIPRRIAVAGGLGKLAAVRASLLGGWVNVLITDSNLAAALLDHNPASAEGLLHAQGS